MVVTFLQGQIALRAQDFELYRPREPQSRQGQPELPDAPPAAEGSDRVLLEELKGIIFVDHPDKVVQTEIEATGVQIRSDSGLYLLDSPTGRAIANKHLGQPVSILSLNQLSREIILLYRRYKQPVVDVSVPEQDITDGVVQIVVTEARVGKVRVNTHGWFDPCVLADKTCLCRGDLIHESTLFEDIRYLSLNPYREASVRLTPGDEYGVTDVIYDVNDRAPWSSYLGYEDTGNLTTGRERSIYGVNWGNAFGLDHSASYQYTASRDFFGVQAHSGVYTVPLHNRDNFTVFGSYASINSNIAPGFNSNGFAWQVSGRYYYDLCPGPCRPRGCKQNRLVFGADFKRTNTSLIFGQNIVFDEIADSYQFLLGYESEAQYRNGYGRMGVDFFFSPGEQLTSFNTNTQFNALRQFARADYAYARGYIERTWRMPYGMMLWGKATGQLAEGNLISSEQLGFGGYNSVRGYDMRIVNGDSGWLLNAELRTTPVDFSGGFGRCHQLQGLAFFDYGEARNHTLVPGEPVGIDLMSVGVGFRYSLGRNISLRFDYGWQLERDNILANASSSRPHIGAVGTF